MRKEEHENKSWLGKIIALFYVGEGSKVGGIPAHDLTADEVDRYGGFEFLKSTGLYASQSDIELDGGK